MQLPCKKLRTPAIMTGASQPCKPRIDSKAEFINPSAGLARLKDDDLCLGNLEYDMQVADTQRQQHM